jgi:hypothetical protein
MSWKEIVKAPTLNYQKRGYRGGAKYSAINDSLMAQIVKGLGLPEKNEDGDEIQYEEDYDYLDLDISADIDSPDITITVKPKGKISIYTSENTITPVYTFKEDKIIMEDFSVNIPVGEKVTLDFEIVDFNDGKLYLELTGE